MPRKPPPPGPGRPKGSKNRVNIAFRDAVIEAFHGMGGVPGLITWGRTHRTEFYKIAARLIPTELQHSVSKTLEDILEGSRAE